MDYNYIICSFGLENIGSMKSFNNVKTMEITEINNAQISALIPNINIPLAISSHLFKSYFQVY